MFKRDFLSKLLVKSMDAALERCQLIASARAFVV